MARVPRQVLVMLDERNQTVSFHPASGCVKALKAAVANTFCDVVPPVNKVFFQLKSEDWGGVFLDLLESDDVKCTESGTSTSDEA